MIANMFYGAWVLIQTLFVIGIGVLGIYFLGLLLAYIGFKLMD